MSSSNAYRATQTYQSVSVSVPPLKAIVMLLDGSIIFLKKSIAAKEQKRFEDSYKYLIRATNILRGLSHHLNPNKGGDISARLFNTYNSLIVACLTSYSAPDAATRCRRIVAGLAELRDAWAFVASEKYKSDMLGKF